MGNIGCCIMSEPRLTEELALTSHRDGDLHLAFCNLNPLELPEHKRQGKIHGDVGLILH